MKHKFNINKIAKISSQKKNVNQFLRKYSTLNETQIVKAFYDFQAGNYVKMYKYKRSYKNLKDLIKEINITKFSTFLDFGGGELTNFHTILKNIKNAKSKIFFCCDLSFLRIYHGVEFLKKKKHSLNNMNFFVNNGIDIPLPDSSIDLVTTCHVIEPNKIKASKIIKELYRITKKKLILLEPDNTLIQKNNRFKKKINKRFNKHNYVKNIDSKLKRLNIDFKKIELKNHFNKLNPASIFIIKKNPKKINKPYFLNPFKKNDKLSKTENYYFSKKKDRKFNIINGIALLNNNESLIG